MSKPIGPDRNLSTGEEDDDIDLPLISGERTCFPGDGICPSCGEQPVLEPNTFVALTGGGLLMNRDEDFGGPSDLMDGFLEFAWHEAHVEDPGEPSGGCILSIAQGVIGGQFGIFCCSIKCLRELLNKSLDRMEKMISESTPA